MADVTAEMIERGRRGDPDEAARRRKMTIKLKHARHALTSSTGDAAGPFDSMVRLFAESARSTAPAAALLTLGTGVAVQFWAPLDFTIAWVLVALAMIGARYWLGAAYLCYVGLTMLLSRPLLLATRWSLPVAASRNDFSA